MSIKSAKSLGIDGRSTWRLLSYAGRPFQSIGFTSSTTWTVPSSYEGVFTIIAIGGGAGGAGMNGSNTTTAAGGSGRKTTTTISLFAGEQLVITIGGGGGGAPRGSDAGGAGGNTSIVRSGVTILQATGGSGPGDTAGGSGGSGGGGAGNASGQAGGQGGTQGSNGQNGASGVGGAGQSGVGYGSGTDLFIPPGGNGSYNGTGYYWPGIFGWGAGNRSVSNPNGNTSGAESGVAAGGGGSGGQWQAVGRNGQPGLVVIYG